MTIHLIGLPHTQFNADTFSSCAFTAKAVRTAKMLRMRDIDVITYWGGDEADESCLSVERQESFFGVWTPNALPMIQWDMNMPYWQEFLETAMVRVAQNIKAGDVIAMVMGGSVCFPFMERFGRDFTIVEIGVGYEGICRTGTLACFESYAWMHNRYGAYGINDGRAFDTVIPNAVDPDAWEMRESKGYALFVGRLIQRKGPHVAAQIADAIGLPLLMAGGGVRDQRENFIVATDGTEIAGKDVKHIGAVTGEDRRRLFAEAEVMIVPTLYIGPWEGVHAEAMMSGVPVIAPDYGVFAETLPRRHRYRALKDAVRAYEEPHEKRGEWWREYAIDLCGIEHCADLYADWFARIDSLRSPRKGWYELSADWPVPTSDTSLDTLTD